MKVTITKTSIKQTHGISRDCFFVDVVAWDSISNCEAISNVGSSFSEREAKELAASVELIKSDQGWKITNH